MTLISIAASRQPSLVAATRKYHGLGNRVRVVLGARSLARLEDRRFFYTWQTGAVFGARFDELWEFHENQISTPTARLLSLRYPFRNETLGWLDARARMESVWQIRTPHALLLPAGAIPWDEELRALRPVEPIRERVWEFFGRHLSREPYVGVMIRAHEHSHAATLRDSPVSWYVRRMGEIRNQYPGVQFFLSADTEDARRQVTDAIPGSHFLENKGTYNSKQGLASAVADLYLLAGASHILGPHFSSFPEMAQKLAGPGVQLETSQNDPERHFAVLSRLTRVDDPTRPHVRRVA